MHRWPQTCRGAAAIVTLALSGAACGTAVPRVDAGMAAHAGLPQQQLTEGRRLYIASCTGCHELYPVNTHDAAGWADTLLTMGPKARLNVMAHQRIASYLSAATMYTPR